MMARGEQLIQTNLGQIPSRMASAIAHAMADGVRDAIRARFESQENYGYGIFITCDTEEERSYIESNRTMCLDTLRRMADAGVQAAIDELLYLKADSERYTAACGKADITAIAPGTVVKFVVPVQFSKHGLGTDMVTKHRGVVLGHVVSPVDLRLIYKVRLNKHRIINQDPSNIEVA